jgi:tRNA dimethylallyltransferase
MNQKFLIVVTGPTAIGKTGLAISLAKQLGTEIINADSRQIYREMVIGTAVPTKAQQADIRHHFINHKSIQEYYNASLFEREAIELLDKLFRHHDMVILTGGSGMYIDAVCNGIDDLPTIDPAVREKVRQEYHTEGLEGICTRLMKADPDYFQKVDVNNPQRLMKALEVIEMTGKPYSSYLTGKSKSRSFRTIKIGLDMPRPKLHENINKRVDAMMSDGLLEEVRLLYPFRHLNALNTVGYKELFDYLDSKWTLNEAIEKIKGHTRQYARRQLTWFRKDKEIRWFHPDEYDQMMDFIFSVG